ncbi:hypothetical protein [Allomuricauda sp. d1]
MIQTILAYSILAMAIGYLAKRYVLPKSIFSSTKHDIDKGCGSDDCGCH